MSSITEVYLKRWAVREENTVGGWCIMLESEPLTPADGGFVFVDLILTKDIAQHIVNLHNETVKL